jgi:PAS domain S-box-containing protein
MARQEPPPRPEDAAPAPLALEDAELQEHLWSRAAALASRGHWIWDDVTDRCLFCSEELARIHEMTVAEYMELLGAQGRVYDLIHPEDRERYRVASNVSAQAGESYRLEARIITKHGRVRHIREAADIVRAPDGRYLYTAGIVQDVTDQKQVEEELRRSKDALARVFDAVSLPLFVVDRLGRVTLWNAAAERAFGWSAGEVVGRFNPVIGADRLRELRQRVGSEAAGPFEVTGHRKGGDQVPLALSLSWGGDLAAGELVAIAVDLSEQRAAELELERRREQMRFAVEALPVPLIVTRLADGVVIFANAAAMRIHGVEPGVSDMRNGPYYWTEEHRALFRDTFLRDGRVDGLEVCYRRADGKPFWAAVTAERINFGGVEAVAGVALDITQLREAGERLRQAQKMEAVGQLTGGIAHDFNNLLTVILGNAETLAVDAALPGEARALAALIMSAAERGSTLTRQLLAFARRQPLHPTAVDINLLIGEIHELLRSALPVGVALRLDLEPALPPALVDRGQLEAALLNLVLNARDALSGQGEVVIVTRPAGAPGTRQVEISVQDDGPGMTPEVQARAFEPFFTTKEIGKGSGLGLASVYGFAVQSGGEVRLDSAPGRGTRVSLLLNVAAEERLAPQAAPVPVARGGSETVLLVEDEASVRDFVALLLRRLGYRVLAADSGPAALPLLQGEEPVDLLLTDVVMPGGMNGQQLAAAARRQYPDMPVLLMSGYSGELPLGGTAGAPLPLLRKPFNRRQFADAVRAALDRIPATE